MSAAEAREKAEPEPGSRVVRVRCRAGVADAIARAMRRARRLTCGRGQTRNASACRAASAIRGASR
ncbi:MAG TPA: hypothetical protein VKV38_11890, partial [Trebonia sp.]|nr:hypothetical protein [Trebonia sp.]